MFSQQKYKKYLKMNPVRVIIILLMCFMWLIVSVIIALPQFDHKLVLYTHIMHYDQVRSNT